MATPTLQFLNSGLMKKKEGGATIFGMMKISLWAISANSRLQLVYADNSSELCSKEELHNESFYKGTGFI